MNPIHSLNTDEPLAMQGLHDNTSGKFTVSVTQGPEGFAVIFTSPEQARAIGSALIVLADEIDSQRRHHPDAALHHETVELYSRDVEGF